MKIIPQILLCLFCLAKLCFGGHLAPQGREHGGRIAEDGFLPFMATIHTTLNLTYCAGVIIASQWILTAAVCLLVPAEYMRVGTGGVYWTNHDALYSVEKHISHFAFTIERNANNIGLIKLSTPIVFTERTQHINMAQKNNLKGGDTLLIAGRGIDKVPNLLSEILRIAEVKYMEREECLVLSEKRREINEGNICTETRNGAGVCTGDYGGPLTLNNNLLVGIINVEKSFNADEPDIYASVAYYFDWINNTING